jgi:hypothetical protein
MSMINEAALRRIVRTMLLESDEPQVRAGRSQARIDINAVAKQVQDTINQREVHNLNKMNLASKSMARSQEPRQAAFDKLRTGKALVAKVTTGKGDKGMYQIVVQAAGKNVSLVKKRSRQDAVTNDSKTHYLFETEDEMKKFIGKVVGHMGLQVATLSVDSVGGDASGVTSYGYYVDLKPV